MNKRLKMIGLALGAFLCLAEPADAKRSFVGCVKSPGGCESLCGQAIFKGYFVMPGDESCQKMPETPNGCYCHRTGSF